MAISLVQSKIANSGAVAVSTVSITLDTPPTAGNILVVSGAVLSTAGNITINFDPNISWMYWATSGANNTGIFVAVGRVFAGAGSTFTLTQNSGGHCVSVMELSGTNITVDRIITTTGISATVATGTTGTTSKATQVWIASMSARNAVTYSGPTNGFTILFQDKSSIASASDRSLAVLTFYPSAVGTASTAATISVAGAWEAFLLALQENLPTGGGGESAFGSST